MSGKAIATLAFHLLKRGAGTGRPGGRSRLFRLWPVGGGVLLALAAAVAALALFNGDGPRPVLSAAGNNAMAVVGPSGAQPIGGQFDASVSITAAPTPYWMYWANVKFDDTILTWVPVFDSDANTTADSTVYSSLGGATLHLYPNPQFDYNANGWKDSTFAASLRPSGTTTATGLAVTMRFQCLQAGTSPLHLVTPQEDTLNSTTTLADGGSRIVTDLTDGSVECGILEVNSTGDLPDFSLGDPICDDGTGHCTLRAAIMQANADAGPDTITFNIPAGAQGDPGCNHDTGVCTITPGTTLPWIAYPVTIDGTTQPGYAGSPIIDLSGAAGVYYGLDIQAPDSTVRGLVINGFAGGPGIALAGAGATGDHIEGNYIGTDVSGMEPQPNQYGVLFYGGNDDTVGGTGTGERNVISGNTIGVAVGGSGNSILGNYIGTNAAGDGALANVSGVWLPGPGNTVGGTAAGAENTIAYNTGDGVKVDGATATGNTIRRNHIYANGGLGIDNTNGGNLVLPPPAIDSAPAVQGGPITGTACEGCYVEVFSDDGNQGKRIIGHTIAGTGGAFADDGQGNGYGWSLAQRAVGPYVTATATDPGGNTSKFSDASPVEGAGLLGYFPQIDLRLSSEEPSAPAGVNLDIQVPPSTLNTEWLRLLMSGSDWFPGNPRRPATEIPVGGLTVEIDAGGGLILTAAGAGGPTVPIPLYAVADPDFAATLDYLPADINQDDVIGAFKANGADAHIWFQDLDITSSYEFDGTGYAFIVDRDDGKPEMVFGTAGYASIVKSARVTRVHLNLDGQVGSFVVRQNSGTDGYFPVVARADTADSQYSGINQLALGMACFYIGTGTPPTDSDGDCLVAGALGEDDGNQDQDNDGLPDGFDLLCGSQNTITSPNYDGDSYGDWEECARGTDPDPWDTDVDGFSDAVDNCPLAKNPSQADFDRDGQGDACDLDDDGDYLTDRQEQSAVVTLVGDDSSTLDMKENTFRCDFGGGLSTQLNPRERDTDHDGFLDGAECALGSDPTNNPGGVGYVCPPGVPYSTPEIVGNLKDDDCDGLVDEKPVKLLVGFQEGGTSADDPDSDGLMNAGSDTGISWETVAGTCRQVRGDASHPPVDLATCTDPDYWAVPAPPEAAYGGNGAHTAQDDAGPPQIADVDGDGLTDGDEFMRYGTSLVNLDTDNDGCADSEEVAGAPASKPGSTGAYRPPGLVRLLRRAGARQRGHDSQRPSQQGG